MTKDEGHKSDNSILLEIRDMFHAWIREQRRRYSVESFEVKYYTGPQVEKMFGIKTRQLARWRKQKKIPFVKKGGQSLYPKLPIDRLFEGDEKTVVQM